MADIALKNFNGGQFSELLSARDEYLAANRRLLNVIPSVQGPVTRRGGTRFITSQPEGIRLVPFIFSVTQSYMIVFSETKIRIFYNNSPVAVIDSPYAVDDVPDIWYYQSQDVMFLTHRKYKQKRLVRSVDGSGNVTFSLSDMDFINGPYLPENETQITLSLSETTLTASSDLFSSSDVGRWVRLTTISNSQTKVCDLKITAYTNARTVTISKETGDSFNVSSVLWQLGAFSDALGWPEIIILHEQRLFCFAGGRGYASKENGQLNFLLSDENGVVNDSNGFDFVISLEQSGSILWAVSQDVLIVGSNSGEYIITSTSLGQALTPSNKKAARISSKGSSSLRPEVFDEGVCFSGMYRRSVYFALYSTTYDRFEVVNITKFNRDITRGKIVSTTFAAEPQPVLWMAKMDGGLIGCTVSMTEGVVAWFEADISGKVKDIAAIPNFNGERHDLYMLVEREINGQTVIYLEVMEEGLKDGASDTMDAFFVDCGKSYESVDDMSVVTGLDYLEGMDVDILGDGAVQPRRKVSGGSITLQTPAKVVHVGLPFKSVVEPSPLSLGQGNEKSKKKISNVKVSVYKTVGMKAGRSEQEATQVSFRSSADKMDVAVPLYTGVYDLNFGGGWDEDADVTIMQEQPLPMCVRALYVSVTKGG